MTKSDFQIQHTCYTHVKSCVYLCIVQGSTLVQSIELATQEQLDREVDALFKDTPSGQVMSKKLYCQFNNVADDGNGQVDEAEVMMETGEQVCEVQNVGIVFGV